MISELLYLFPDIVVFSQVEIYFAWLPLAGAIFAWKLLRGLSDDQVISLAMMAMGLIWGIRLLTKSVSVREEEGKRRTCE